MLRMQPSGSFDDEREVIYINMRQTRHNAMQSTRDFGRLCSVPIRGDGRTDARCELSTRAGIPRRSGLWASAVQIWVTLTV
jgi:hypothetical protein